MKNHHFPRNPKTAKEIVEAFQISEIFEEYAFNLQKSKLFYIDTVEVPTKENFKGGFFTIFASHHVIDMIKESIAPEKRNYLLNGTFKVSPKGFYQQLIIHIEVKNDIIPVIYVLMSGKAANLYEEVFNFIEKRIFSLRPSKFMTDFEAGLRKALSKVYPGITLHGCWYHFVAAVRRRFLSYHLYELIKDEPNVKFIYRSLLNLPLLPPEAILNGYNLIKREAMKSGFYKQLKPMLDYFESFWLALVSIFISKLN